VAAYVKALSMITTMIMNWTATKISCDSTYVRSRPLPSCSSLADECDTLPIVPRKTCLWTLQRLWRSPNLTLVGMTAKRELSISWCWYHRSHGQIAGRAEMMILCDVPACRLWRRVIGIRRRISLSRR
jgi:hypothetical protein